eukprot:9526530-Alexandrium_andersonii.AAC.1
MSPPTAGVASSPRAGEQALPGIAHCRPPTCSCRASCGTGGAPLVVRVDEAQEEDEALHGHCEPGPPSRR